jgi:Fe-S-cluster containining protein
MSSRVRCLSFHAHYACRRRGACCTSNWPIPIEADRLIALQAAVATGALTPAATDTNWMTTPADAPEDAPALLGVRHGRCVFFDEAGGRACRIHASLGHEALPLACRQFPRIVVRDPRGISVTLSHYCPTAASLLDGGAPVTIVDGPPAFPPRGDYEGLDASTALPPLLRPDMLLDWASWWRWEAESVSLLTTGDEPAAMKLGRLREAVERVRDWRPSPRPLEPLIGRAFETARRTRVELFNPDREEVTRRLAEIDDAIPSDLRPEPVALDAFERGWRDPPHADRFLAAHAFANWIAHLGEGLDAWLRSIEAAYVCLRTGMDVRQADLRLRHLANPNRLAHTWSHPLSL